MSPPMTIVWPLCTVTIVCTERVLIGGASPGSATAARDAHLGLHVERDEAAGVDVRRHLQQHAGVDVLRRRRDDVGRRRAARRSVCWLIGIRLPALIVAFWLSSAARCGLAIDLGVAVGVEQAQHRLDAAREVRVVDDVGEALRELETPAWSRRVAADRRD